MMDGTGPQRVSAAAERELLSEEFGAHWTNVEAEGRVLEAGEEPGAAAEFGRKDDGVARET